MTDAGALRAIAEHFRTMPPVAGMGITIHGFDGDALRLGAPLARHVNDKGSAFGGSLASLMTLAGWGLVTLQLHAAAIDAEVYVADSHVRYLKPLLADLDAEARLAPGGDWGAFMATLHRRGRARVELATRVALPCGGVATEGRARYVAIARR